MVVSFSLHCSSVLQPALQQFAPNASVLSSLAHCPSSLPLPGEPVPHLFNYFSYSFQIKPFLKVLWAYPGDAPLCSRCSCVIFFRGHCNRGSCSASPVVSSITTLFLSFFFFNYPLSKTILVSVKWNCHLVNGINWMFSSHFNRSLS